MSWRHATTAARILLGLLFFVSGLNGFLKFIPMKPPPPAGGAFMGALVATGYMIPLIKGTELLAGVLLLGNRFVPLALTLLAPILVNIVAYHVVLTSDSYVLLAVLIGLELLLAWAYRESFRDVLAARAQPVVPTEARGATRPGQIASGVQR
ncbi:DoxX family protein [Sorangium sp. So ce861]|uniref:DoxX family protein n=1 Tax=Sorangium sp. So ce861 TaxID=3133323 RepID=UPI003F627D1B